MDDNPLFERQNIFETTVEEKRAAIRSTADTKKAESAELPISIQLSNELNELTAPVPPPAIPYSPPRDVLETVGDIGGAGIVGAAQIIFDAPLSAPAVLADALSAGAKEILRPEDYEKAAKDLSEFRMNLGFMDFVGDKIVEKADRFYGNDTTIQKAEAQLRQSFQVENTIYGLTAGIIETTVDNPGAIGQITAQSLPQMAALASKGVPFAIAFLDLVGDRVQESKGIYEKEFGKSPQGNAYFTMLAAATVATAIETVESKFLLGKLKPPTTKIANAISKIPAARTVVRGFSGGLAEFGEEASAQLLTEFGGKQTLAAFTDEQALEEAFVSGGLGAGSGAGIAIGRQALPDVAQTVVQAADLTKAGVEKVGAITTKARLEKAVTDGNNLTIAEIGLETDFTKLNSEERTEKVTEIFSALSAIDAEAEAETDPIKRKAILDSAETAQEQFRAVLQSVTDINARENNQPTIKDAERVIAEAPEEITDESTQAVQTVMESISQGNTVEDATVTSIKGSKLFDILDTGQKELLDLYEDYSQNFDSLEKVQSDILQGNTEEGFLGIQQQQQRVAQAIQFGNKGAANTALSQLKTLRDNQVAKLAAPPKNPKFKTHKDTFVAKVTREIEALNSAISFLDKTVKQAFDSSILTDADLKKPTVEVFGGTEAKAEDVANEIARIDSKIKTIQDSQIGRTESSPEAEAAIGAKQEEISRLAAKRDSLRRQQTKETSKPEPVSDQAKNQLSDLIDRLTDPKQKERAQAAFDRSTTKAHFERLRSNVRTALNKQQEKADQESREAIERQAAEINQDVATDTDTDVEVSVVGKIEGFDAILEMQIPESKEYVSKSIKQRVKVGNRTLKNTYRSLIIRQDNLLRAVQDIVENCNG